VHDQRGIVRGYMKYDGEIRTGRQLTCRALQIAASDPKGPVYLMGAREVMEEAIPQPPPAPASG
jgi:acetolactate synthase-1/2/3 large subunit